MKISMTNLITVTNGKVTDHVVCEGKDFGMLERRVKKVCEYFEKSGYTTSVKKVMNFEDFTEIKGHLEERKQKTS